MNAIPQTEDRILHTNGFSALLSLFNDAHSIGSDDVIAACLPVLKQAAEAHDAGRVAPVTDPDALGLAGGVLFFKASHVQPSRQNKLVTGRKRPAEAALHIVDEVDFVVEETEHVLLGGQSVSASDRRVSEDETGRPSFLTDYRSWEIENGHHDPVTDIYLLGMMLASLATGLDFRDREQLETFTAARQDLQRLNGRLHPVLVRAIERMTALERYDRAQDLHALCDALENYRRIGSDFEQPAKPRATPSKERDTEIIKRLRARLYDTSRRNRLLYHRPIAGELDLTEASVPLVLNPDLIKAGDLFTGTSKAMKKLIAGNDLVLGDWIRFEEMLFVPPVLARLRLDARRIEQDTGVSPLHLIPAKLHWYDLKNAPDTPITSPLLLLKANLTKRKGVRDAFVLRLEGPEADLNPALAFVLNQLYGMVLPEQVDLSDPNALSELHGEISKQILASEPGVSFTFADKPKRRLLHTTVRRRLDQFQRRQRGHKGKRSGDISDYSYDVENYKPLGVQLFQQRVRIPEAPFRNIAGRPLPRYFNMAKIDGATQTEKSQVFIQQVAASEGRFDWSLDTSSVVLGNFNYQKMSLLRDYDQLARREDLRGSHFRRFFGGAVRELLPGQETRVEDLHNILPSDPSQDDAIAATQSGKSLVLQGPPGTGKSQTIANLIANFVANGKRVLFVSQKRAALDVVHNRLTGAGLGDLTASFHDAKTGRASFVGELGKLYQTWSDNPPPTSLDRLKRDKVQLQERVRTVRKTFEMLVEALNAPKEEPPLHQLLEKAIDEEVDLNLLKSAPSASVASHLPDAATWGKWRDAFSHAALALRRNGNSRAFGESAEFQLRRQLWGNLEAVAELPGKFGELTIALEDIRKRLVNALPTETGLDELSLPHVLELARYAGAVCGLGTGPVLDVARKDEVVRRQFDDDARTLEDLETVKAKTEQYASVWTIPLGLAQAEAALAVALSEETRFFARILSSRLRSVAGLVNARTDLSSLAVKPTLTQLLTWLVEDLKASKALQEKADLFERRYGERSPQEVRKALDRLEEAGRSISAEVAPLALRLLHTPATDATRTLAQTAAILEDAQKTGLELFGERAQSMQLPELCRRIAELRENAVQLPVLAGNLKHLAEAPEDIWALLADADADVHNIDRRILVTDLQRRLGMHPELDAIDFSTLSMARRQLVEALADLRTINAGIVKTRQLNLFRQDIVLSNKPASGLAQEEKERREGVLAARRVLENEFSKSRAFRPVRDLVQDKCGPIVSTIKPIWMMSPTSIADVLPLDNDVFDVVIFDEASQITVEEALPACVRGRQIVVVGDSKQLPPGAYFNATVQDDHDEDEDFDFELDQESLLSLADETLPSVMLRWHYRSRQEALIAFSNTAFYDAALLSIPSATKTGRIGEIVVPDTAGHSPDPETVLGRSLSFHHLPHGIYSARSNEAEASYVAALLRSILMRKTGMTIAIVAFSETQQREIEEAIARLSEEDETFARLLADEQERTEDGEFVGLLVKNLENVQGDERDIVIVSVCYGPNVSRKMRMNFGPINKVGGEKRLNVIFSRARRHMAIVSTITGDEITNDYNTGALALKTILQFARATSAGETDMADRILDRYRSGSVFNARAPEQYAAARRVASWLRHEMGIACDCNVGLSEFVIDVVPQIAAHDTRTGCPVAILIDRSDLYERGMVDEMLTSRAAILEAFGWDVVTIPLKDIVCRPSELKSTLRQYLLPSGQLN